MTSPIDRELLELAAKAAGEKFIPWREAYKQFRQGIINHHWNPLDDDGDALRLAVKLEIMVGSSHKDDASTADWWSKDGVEYLGLDEPHNSDPYAATRRAIVRAAAEIGKGMA